MPTPAERTALGFLAAVAVLGGGVRVARSVMAKGAPPPVAVDALARQRELVDSAAAARQQTGRRGRAGVPRPSERSRRGAVTTGPRRASAAAAAPPLDVDRATEAELQSLPRIGPAIAQRIVAERTRRGAFRCLDSLAARVKGIGPALTLAIAPRVVNPRC